MSLSLIGIIFVQGYWINNTVENNEEQFSFNAKQILISVSNRIQYREFEEMFFPLQEILDSIEEPDNKTIRQLLNISIDNTTKSFTHTDGILEEDYKLFSSFINLNIDTVRLKNILNRNADVATQNDKSDFVKQNSKSKLERIRGLTDLQRMDYEIVISEIASFIPIHRRVQKREIDYLLKKELEERDIKVDFEYAIYSNALATKVRSDDFSLDYPTTYAIPLFVNDEGVSEYQLYVNFTGKKQYVLSSIKGMAILSIIFTLIIVVAYSSALSQLMQQRQISQIKTDFINNMTHELKTPIATINLALDSIKNPKIGGDPEKVQRYMSMIREENKRMHAQVENVLRISQLEKNELNIKKERQELHDIIEDAITHVSLLVENREGYVKMHLGALKTTVLANDSHLTNVIVNILDNAIKYSENEPKIDVYTENVKNSIVLKVRDQGIGMSKVAQKKIFEKFFREHTGDLHNVKGHGLGLTYVKRIIDDHHGQIWVESERGKGSTFIIKLPLIS
ncbi:two-component system phosphate regulon sensor histidine kinase PhoR [Aquimarina sp. EL_43]|nr:MULTISPECIES: HAMP domain-containing sensor histidine kinase [Aquimarina]MBG6132101.1 two-component system phosphate regulon sensor histidine kinase PhoR [Aquimarina sp. EL_35]MBG6152898.1 two-component system phosphate regulon sensor histidine kinase PhoR [Aquimarina sp. EL_32]MBG6170905.1 two-component system phosphate regulon sensor histidine kinase PhoR [Aquimarina sp. EL_43]